MAERTKAERMKVWMLLGRQDDFGGVRIRSYSGLSTIINPRHPRALEWVLKTASDNERHADKANMSFSREANRVVEELLRKR